MPKERLQQLCAAAGQHSAANLHCVVQLRMIYYLHHRMDSPGFGIVRAVHQAFDAGVHHRSGTHGTRFNCNKQLAVSQPMVTNGCTRFAERDDLGMSGGIAVGDVAVPSPPHDFCRANYNCAHRDLSNLEGTLGTAQSFFHPKLVGPFPVVSRHGH